MNQNGWVWIAESTEELQFCFDLMEFDKIVENGIPSTEMGKFYRSNPIVEIQRNLLHRYKFKLHTLVLKMSAPL